MVDVDHRHGIAPGHEAVIAVLEAVGRDLAADPAMAEVLLDTPGYAGTTALTSAGATLRLSGRVRPEARMQVEVEMRRRVAAGMSAAWIELIRPGLGAGGAGGAAPRP